MDDGVQLGRRGEHAAAKHLRGRRYRILERNYRCPLGEIDIVALDGDTVVFAEVKTRSSSGTTDPQISIRRDQQSRIVRAARYFMMDATAQHWPSRFDVLSVILSPRGRLCVEHFVDAFRPVPARAADHRPWA